MTEEKKSLQKFTELEKNELKLTDSVKYLKDKFGLNKSNVEQVVDLISQKLDELKGTKRDEFIYHVWPLLTYEFKNQLWECNHIRINWAISTMIQELGRMPSKMEMAEKTGLSRQTIHKHLKEYTSNSIYQNQLLQFRFMADKVLARIFDFAVNGDMKAAKLYFDILGKNFGVTHNNFVQNNFVQINEFKLSQEQIKQLSPEKLSKIESIIKDVIPEN
ncbi:MAG: hypothetical protein HQ541_21770 [Mariniphaga sp.]|nr:hypothetical protein [Mariniphaga sp.]